MRKVAALVFMGLIGCDGEAEEEASGGSVLSFHGPAPNMPLRKVLEARFEHFWRLLPK